MASRFKLPGHPLVWVLAAALVLRLGAGAWWQLRLPDGARFVFGDSESYWTLGQTIAAGEDYQYGSPDARVFRTPGYPLLLSIIFLTVGPDAPVMWARALNAVLGTLAVAGVYALTRRLFARGTALVAAGLATVYPGAIGSSVFVLSEAPFCPLMMAQLTVGLAAWQAADVRRTAWLALAAGGLAGAATLVRPSWLLFAPFATLVGVATGSARQRHMLVGLATLSGLALVMAPWWIRNARATGHFVPTTLQVGASLYDGLNPRATGASDMRFVREFEEREQRLGAGDGDPLEYRLDRRLREEAIDWAATHPRRALELAAIKFTRLWNVWPNETEFRGLAQRGAVLVSYVPLLILGLIGGWRYRSLGWATACCMLPAVYFSALHMIFVSSIRYREPAMLPWMALAAAAVTGGWSQPSKDVRNSQVPR